jgi:hypothetical protein
MNVIRKDATITNTDDTGPGGFEVILSAPTLDRDGDTLLPEDWKQPLPDHITFDADHGMSVASTVGSGVPTIENGNLVVRGTYSSLPRAQEVRTLVNEGHIRTTSVAFMPSKATKDGKTRTVRELLNGAFVAIPSNRDSVVLASKAFDVKAGARNSKTDQVHMQTAHDHLVAAGAVCAPMDATGAAEGARGGKSYEVKGPGPGALAQAVDAALDEAQNLISQVDPTTLPEEIQQALGLITAAEESIDELLDALGVTDPDEPTETDDEAPAAEKSLDEEAVTLQYRAIELAAMAG